MKYCYIVVLFFLAMISCGEPEPVNQEVVIKTSKGDMVVQLYNSTPLHRDNFLKLVKEGQYTNIPFDKIIKNFTLHSANNSEIASEGSTIPAEIGAPHFKGTLAAAREPDYENPDRMSSPFQFFIVQGFKQSDSSLDTNQGKKGIRYSDIQRKKYRDIGGLPQLDMTYTVFGEIIKGLDVIDLLAEAKVNKQNKPINEELFSIELKH